MFKTLVDDLLRICTRHGALIPLHKRRPVIIAVKRALLPVALLAWAVLSLGCGGSSSTSTVPATTPSTPSAIPGLTKLSGDPYTNSQGQHATEVEPGAFSFASTIVTAFQVGRIFGGGGSDIGFATSQDGGTTWSSGFLPGITIFQGGTYTAVSDAAVAYDRSHGVWLIATLPIGPLTTIGVSRSSDGIHWGNPVLVSASPNSDKPWIACDSTPSSPFFGNCYLEWDDPVSHSLVWMSTSTNGGITWSAPLNTSDMAAGVGGQPLVRPSGKVIVPIQDSTTAKMVSFSSSDGGASWQAAVEISSITDHSVSGGIRTGPLPAAATDAGGTVYVAWQDCRFRTACTSNDMVLSTSGDGVTWTSPARVPIDAVTSTVDHFIAGLAIDPATSGSTAQLALTYYFYPAADCTVSTCSLKAGIILSRDGGKTWSAPTTLGSAMSLESLPDTFSGLMVGDYASAAFSGGKVYPFLAVAQTKTGSEFAEAIYTSSTGITDAGSVVRLSSANELPVPDAHSDHPPTLFRDVDEIAPEAPPR
jgi:hypothetical protein